MVENQRNLYHFSYLYIAIFEPSKMELVLVSKFFFIKTESSSLIKIIFREMNKRLTREACIKIIEQAERTEAEFADCFTAAVTGDSMHDIYKVRYPR